MLNQLGIKLRLSAQYLEEKIKYFISEVHKASSNISFNIYS